MQRLRIPEGMREVHVAPNVGRSSGEYKVSAETEALLRTVKEAAVADTRRDMNIAQLAKDVGESTNAVNVLSDKVEDTNRLITQVVTTQGDHAKQLQAIWDDKRSKTTAWHSFWPSILSAVVSALILACVAFSGAFQSKPAQTAVPTAPAPVAAPAP